MTKAEEMAALAAFIQSLPTDSYLRPWLSEVSGEVEMLIRGDIFPQITIAAASDRVHAMTLHAELQAARVHKHADRHAASIIASAKATAEKVRQSAERDAAEIRSELQDDLRRLSHAIGRVAA